MTISWFFLEEKNFQIEKNLKLQILFYLFNSQPTTEWPIMGYLEKSHQLEMLVAQLTKHIWFE